MSKRPPSPWSNVIANERFGFVATESGMGTTWSENSYHNRLTPWSNDPVVDPPSEVVYLRDDASGEFWTATPSPAAGAVKHVARFGQGYASYGHRHRGLDVELIAFVPKDDPIKIVRLRIRNTTAAARELSAFCYAEWCLADTRSRSAAHIVTSIDTTCGALFARNAFREGFGKRVAFIDAVAHNRSMTGDRSSFIGRNGTLSDPLAMEFAHLPGRVGAVLDPCGAVQSTLHVAAGDTVELTFLLGEGIDEQAARELIGAYHEDGAVDAALKTVTDLWNARLSSVEVETPDRALNILTNRWLVYQVLSCRFFARTAFYQSGGAFGFRDQLQDVLAFLHFDADIARRHIIRAAGRQFREGDVQHWWHEPGGEGVRTRIEDDRLWLVYATLEYARVTGDWAVFDARAPFIEQRAPGPDEHSVYETPVRLGEEASIYEHCTRAIARTMQVGSHGLPLIGTGDWNDGMDEVGAHGRGESVWLGWFLASLLGPFAALAESRGEAQQAVTYRAHAARLTEALDAAWDGSGTAGRISTTGRRSDQRRTPSAVSTRSRRVGRSYRGLGAPARSQQAMASVEKWLVERDHRLILLLTPPFDKAEPNPGYIKGYVPGVRENGGQYTHAALWVVLAQAMLRRGNAAHEMLGFINPIDRSSDQDHVKRYRVEPYVVAADIYSAQGHAGRGGWTWYTGAAGWMYRVTIEHVLGIQREGNWLKIQPCIPTGWPGYKATLRIDGAEYAIEIDNGRQTGSRVVSVTLDGATADRRKSSPGTPHRTAHRSGSAGLAGSQTVARFDRGCR